LQKQLDLRNRFRTPMLSQVPSCDSSMIGIPKSRKQSVVVTNSCRSENAQERSI
jgi:hypothetical protein